jgi:hypothetical protein
MKTRIQTLFIIFSLTCFASLPKTRAVSPPPDGGYAGGNTAEGQAALLSLTTGLYNTGIGIFSLLSLSDGNLNTGVGAGTLLANTADENTATGAGALFSNGIGGANTATGAFALFSNTEGSTNTAIGDFVLFNNTVGNFNTAIGGTALGTNTTGSTNTAIGTFALATNDTGGANTAIGSGGLSSNTVGNFNTAIGTSALTAATGDGNIGVGASAGSGITTASNVICIGTAGSDQSDSCYIGNIFAQEVALDGVPVLVDSLGKLGVQISSRRFKEDIEPMNKASEAILALKPVTFHYKSDTKNTPCFGLIAEEVAKVNPDLVVRDKNGESLTVRYDQVNAMLLNEFLKEHAKVQNLEAALEAMNERLKAQEAKIDKVSGQIESNRSAPQLVINH